MMDRYLHLFDDDLDDFVERVDEADAKYFVAQTWPKGTEDGGEGLVGSQERAG